MNGVVAALGVTFFGVTSTAGAQLAQGPAGTSDIPSYISGGGAAVAVSALAYITKKLLSGDLVPRPIAEYQRELSASISASADREADVMRVAEQTHRLAEQYHKDHLEMRRLMARVNLHLGGPDDRETPRRNQ